jgi:predicted metal-dependent peptidase
MANPTLLQKLKVNALISQPFFATFIFRLPILEDRTCKTAYTNGKMIGFNPEFMEALPFAQALAVLFHEIFHIVFFHHARQGNRNLERWNWATDFSINQILVDNGFSLPDGALLDNQFRGMGAEEIYSLLPENIASNFSGFTLSVNGGKGTQPYSGTDGLQPLLIGEVRPAEFESQKEFEAHAADLKALIAEAVQTAKVQGKMPGGLDRLIDTISRATMDWKEVLASFLTEQFQSDYSFNKPNRRFLHSGIYLPGRQTINRGRFVLAIDTSGSITERRLKEVSAEIMDILVLSSETLHVLYFDSEVAGSQELEEGCLENLQPKGGGGTDFAPVVEHVERELDEPQVLIYFTDGLCNSFAKEPSYPVLWITENLDYHPPYGEIIFMPHAA